MRRSNSVAVLAAASLAGTSCLAQQTSVVDSLHNLSAEGRGDVRAVAEEQVCIFCHTPHQSSPIVPLWNRAMPLDAYTPYTSRALDADPGQPTGASKMCLSCHDGTIALGAVLSRSSLITMRGGITTMPPGRSNLGTDLSDDHPVSFRYTSALSAKDPKIRPPSHLPGAVRLDANSEMQCTTCHNPHNNALGQFLVMHNGNSELCIACHQVDSTTVTGHRDCIACHSPHSAPSGPYLLRGVNVTAACMNCHDGSVHSAPNINPDLHKISVHDTDREIDPPDPIPLDVTCTDCHEPHSMRHGSASAPSIPANFGSVSGVSLSGSAIPVAQFEYEVCFKCHGDRNAVPPRVTRQIMTVNNRLRFDPTAVSFHPVAGPGRNDDVPSLLPPWTTASVMYCNDCHSSDTGGMAGGSGAAGVHGSNHEPLLRRRYAMLDYTSESAANYALCYSCHSRNSILGDESFKGHRRHIVDERTPCFACHDAHGISSQGSARHHSHLMNFDLSIVSPDSATGRLEFVDEGRFQGRCFLTCHGASHSPKEYGP